MNKLITKSLAELNADFIMQIPLELQTKQEMKWFKWIKDYIATFGQPPTLDRFCIEFSDFVSIETNDPLKDVFFLDVGFRRNSLVREWIIANSESLREGKDPYRELSLFLEKLNDDIETDKKICIISMTSTFIENMVDLLKKLNVKYIIHTSNVSDSEKKKLENVN